MKVKYSSEWPQLLGNFVNYGFKWFGYFQKSNLSPKSKY